jgi:hypothetical protein
LRFVYPMSGKDQEPNGPQAVDLTALELDQLLSLFIGMLSAKAWQYMGIRLKPGKKETEKDLAKASATIDCVSYLVEKAIPYILEEEASKLRALVTDLQINFARQT